MWYYDRVMKKKRSLLQAAFDWLELTEGARGRNRKYNREGIYEDLNEYKSFRRDGPKLVGDILIEYLEYSCGLSIKGFQGHLSAIGLSSIPLVKWGAEEDYETLYIYNAEALSQFLNHSRNVPILEKANWPMSPHDFIKRLASNEIKKEQKELYDLIAVTFNGGNHQEQRESFDL